MNPIDLSDSTAMTGQGTIPSGWTLRPLGAAEDTTFGALSKRPTLLTVGATWCEPCTATAPVLEALHDSIGQDVRVMFVSPEPRDSLRQYVDEEEYSMPTYGVDDLPSSLSGDLLPRTYLVRSDGTVVYRYVGPADWNVNVVRRLLRQSQSSAASRISPRPAVRRLYAGIPR